MVVRRTQGGQGDGKARDVVYDVTFAFVYNAFFPGRKIHVNCTPVGGMGAAPLLPSLCLAVIHG